MKVLLIIIGLLVITAILFILFTYSNYHKEMGTIQKRLTIDSKIFKTEYGDIEYAVRGDGVPVLLLHGAGGGYDQGLWIGKRNLEDGYKLISVSRFGYLRSSIPSQASINNQAVAYKELLAFLKIDKVIVIGGSAGGPSAMQFANDYPKYCSALILLSAVSMADAPGDKAPFYIDIIHLIQQSDYGYWLFTKFLQPVILNLMGIPSQLYASFTPEQKELAQEMLDTMHPMSQRYIGTLNDGKMIQLSSMETEKISAPTLIIHSKDDALVSSAHAENSHKKIKQSKLISLDTGGHVMLSQIDKVRKDIKEFLIESLGN
jgi:pimeloyl-ACP methyl ester carboxylesterase